MTSISENIFSEIVRDLSTYSKSDILILARKWSIPFVNKSQAVNVIAYKIFLDNFKNAGRMNNTPQRQTEIDSMNSDCGDNEDFISGESWASIPTARYVRPGDGLNNCYDLQGLLRWVNTRIRDNIWPNDSTTRDKIYPRKLNQIYNQISNTDLNIQDYPEFTRFINGLRQNNWENFTIQQLENELGSEIDRIPIRIYRQARPQPRIQRRINDINNDNVRRRLDFDDDNVRRRLNFDDDDDNLYRQNQNNIIRLMWGESDIDDESENDLDDLLELNNFL